MARKAEGNGLIALGTVKLGDPSYGFSTGRTPRDFDPVAFLALARSLGVERFDTSPRYGEAEAILGRYVSSAPSPPFLSTKIDGLAPGIAGTGKAMERSVRRSLDRLGVDRLDLVYLHQNEIGILSDPAVREGLLRLRGLGLVRMTGASVYSHEECACAVESGVFDAVQIPVSVFDSGFYDRFVRGGGGGKVRFVARSLLLQGLLARPGAAKGLHAMEGEIRDCIRRIGELAGPLGLTAAELGLAYVFSLPGLDHCVVGTTSEESLREILACAGTDLPAAVQDEVSRMAAEPKAWTNPRSWTR